MDDQNCSNNLDNNPVPDAESISSCEQAQPQPRTVPSLSIVTITPDTLDLLQRWNQSFHSVDNNVDDEEKEEDDEDEDEIGELPDSGRFRRHQSTLRRKSNGDLKLRKIVYGNNDPEMDMEDEEEEEEEEKEQSSNNQKTSIDKESKNRKLEKKENDISYSEQQMAVLNLLFQTNSIQKPPQQPQLVLIQPTNKIPKKSILKPPSLLSDSSPIQTTNGSIGECSIGTRRSPTVKGSSLSDNNLNDHNHKNQNLTDEKRQNIMNRRMNKLLSIMYAIFIIIIGSMITLADMDSATNDRDHLYNIIITFIGIIFLTFIHIDIQRHKRFVLRWQLKRKEHIEGPFKNGQQECDSVSVTTAIIFNRIFLDESGYDFDNLDEETKNSLNGYRFLIGKHSGSFYLKIGMTLFCMGSMIHQGINLAFQIHFFINMIDECKNVYATISYFLHCVSAFYQLYMAFKYSNLIINRNEYLVRFGLMHLFGSSLSFWFSSIMEESIHGYMEDIQHTFANNTLPEELFLQKAFKHHQLCSNNSMGDLKSIDAMHYFYPFSIEFNIILASVWYIIWTNVSNDDYDHSQMYDVREEINEDPHTGTVDIQYKSNLSVNIDFHGSYLGMFTGFLILLVIVITIIMFFTTIEHEQYQLVGISIYSIQYTLLTICCSVTVPIAFYKTRKLNITKHLDSAQTSMDDLLLLLPLPFYYVHHILCIYAEYQEFTINSIIMASCYLLNLIQVIYQTPFIIDGLRRCSNKSYLQKMKPGKQLITFILIINVIMWILITFEIKSIDQFHSMPKKFGKFVWMIILDTCLPLMLFYRFHSSVCLSDMWKHCYEKDDH